MHNLIKTMSEHGVYPYLEEGKLKTRSKSQQLPPDLIAQIKANKEALIQYLQTVSSESADGIPRQSAAYSELPLSFNQERLWLTHQIGEGSTQYNIATSLKLSGALNQTALQQAFDCLLQRHEVLRTQFFDQQGQCQLRLSGTDSLPIAQRDLSQLQGQDQQEAIQTLAQQEAEKPFDLGSDLMLRVTLLKLAAQEHIVLFTLHHIASDGWSIGLLVKEFSEAYQAFASGQPPQLPDNRLRYVDFAKWQRDKLSGEGLTQALDFWREQLADIPKLHNLPLDYPRPVQQQFTGARITTRLSPTLTAQVNQFAESSQSTLFMVLQCAYALLINQYSGDEDVVIGSPVAGRTHQDTESLVGFFANAVAYRNRIQANDSFRSLLERAKDYATAVFEYQDMPFSLLVKALESSRSLAYSPIFQLSFTMQNNERSELKLGDLAISSVPVEQSKTLFDLSLFATPIDDELVLEWLYDNQLFAHERIQAMADNFSNLLEQVLKQPQLALNQLPLVPHQGLWQGPQSTCDIDVAIHSLFEAQVAAAPDAIALQFEDQQYSYAELNAEANKLAHYLLSKGVVSEAIVGVSVERSAEMLIAILGVLKAGAAYLPLSPSLPSKRLEFMAQDANIDTLITQQSLMNALDIDVTTTVLIDANWRQALFKTQPDSNPSADGAINSVSGSQLAYVIYTSGSTGQPKGVMVEHRSLVNNAYAQRDCYRIDSSSNVLQFVAFGFDVAVSDWAMAWISGAKLTVLNDSQRLQIPLMSDVAKRTQATHLQITAAMLPQLPAADFPSFKVLILGGSAANPEQVAPWQQQGCEVINAYGPTEAAIASSAQRLSADVASNNIGCAFANVGYAVLDKQLQPVPVGAIGELAITGAGLARGYLNQPELTQQSFVNVLLDGQTHRVYRTGDLVKLCADGSCEFVGRSDEQIKIRGFRIELGEVEAALRQLSGVKDVAVVVQGSTDTPKLVAYFVARYPVSEADEREQLNQWRREAEAQLPDYMVPNLSMLLDTLPLSSNGKVDKKALPEIDISAQVAEYQAPETAAENILCEVWQTLLQVEQVGTNDNFFALGGDSIIAIQVVARARQAGLGLTTKLLFEFQSIKELAPHTHEVQEAEVDYQSQGSQILLPIQQQFLALANGSEGHFNQSVLLQPPADFDLEAAQAVLTAVVKRHDVLRLQFAKGDSAHSHWQANYLGDAEQGDEFDTHIAQVVSGSVELLTLDDAADNTADSTNNADAAASLITSACVKAQADFDLRQGPLLKMWLLQRPSTTGAQQTVRLFIVAHHLVVDGVSWRILLADIEQAYRQWQQGSAIQLAGKTQSYQAWATWLQNYGDSAAVQQQLPFWQEQIRVAQPLPAMDPKQQPLRRDTAKVAIAFDADTTTQLLTQTQQGFSLQTHEVLITGVLLALKRWSELDEFNLILESHGREAPEGAPDVTETLGWFTSTYPLLMTLPDTLDPDLMELIVGCKEQLRQVPDKGLGYGCLRYLNKALASSPYANALAFNYLGQFDQSVANDGPFALASEATGDNISADFPRIYHLGLNGKVVGGQLQFNLDYCQREYQSASMEQLASHIHQSIIDVINACVAQRETLLTPSDFPLANTSRESLLQWQQQYPIRRLYPATPMQRGMLYHSQLDSGAYVSQAAPLLRGQIDTQLFRRAWQHVVDRHDIFRTAFVAHEGQLQQLVVEQAEMPWQEDDWRDLSPAEQETKFEQLRREDRARGFEMAMPPLQRITLIQVADDAYRVLWTHHHMLLDGWCSPLVYQDVLLAYQQLAAGKAIALPAIAPYEQYIAWLQLQDATQAKAYWRDYLAGIEQVTDLGILSPGDAKASDQRMLTYSFSSEHSQALKAFASQHQTTVNTVLQLAWAYVLHRYSDQETVVFGTPISGRPPEVAGVETMVGLFINTVPVRVDFTPGKAIHSILAELQQQFQLSNQQGYLPLTDIQEQSELPSGQALFNSMFIFENYPLDTAANESEAGQALPFSIESYQSYEGAAYPMALSAALRDQLNLKLYFDSAVVEEDTMAAVLDHVKLVINGFLEQAALEDIVLLSDKQQQALEQWRGEPVPYPEQQTVHQLFAEVAATHSQRIAMVAGDTTLTYAEVDVYANQMAHGLIAAGLLPEERVAIFLDRQVDSFIALLAILKAGGAYVPVDMSNPVDRVEHFIQESDARLVLVPKTHTNQVSNSNSMVLSADREQYHQYPTTAPDISVSSDQLAYVIFTSGSTGKPKGVMVEHHSLVNLIHNDVRRYEVEPGDKLLHCTTMGFDAGTAHMFKILGGGGELHIIEPKDNMVNYTNAHQITHLAATVARFEMTRPEAVPSVKVVVTGGDAVSPTLVERWGHRCKLFNVYGPTEATIAATTGILQPGDKVELGSANANYYLYILDSKQHQVPYNVPGELYIGGPGVARGYINRPDLTAERFIANPFKHRHAPRLYRTGDLVRLLPCGRLMFAGRIDQQVKIRGYRIELDEIKAQIIAYSDILEANVSVFGEASQKALVCHYSSATGEELDEQALRRFVAKRLPEYMQPAAWVYMANMPHTPNGKIDLKALPAPDFEQVENYVAPSTDTEQAIADIWAHCLGLERVGIESNFFALGGNSLTLSQVLYEVNARFGIQIELKQLFEAQTVAASALLVDALISILPPLLDCGEDDIDLEEGVL